MKTNIWVLLFLFRTMCVFSQTTRFSQSFEFNKKNLPVEILNQRNDQFYVLRYNRIYHDFVIERRSKSNGELLKATALGLDAINANWFNYENLDYILHEVNGTLYFVFEKVLSHKREIYFRTIDSLGRPGEYKLLTALDKGKGIEQIDFEFKLCEGNKLLIVGNELALGGQMRKLVIWYDLIAENIVWAKRLPIEYENSTYSAYYETNTRGDLYFVYLKRSLETYLRKFVSNRQLATPYYSYDVVSMACLPVESKTITQEPLGFSVGNLMYASISADTSQVLLNMNYGALDTITHQGQKLFLYRQKWTDRFRKPVYLKESPIETRLEKQLDFFDGMDYSQAAYRDYPLLNKQAVDQQLYLLSGRRDESFYKEMFLCRFDVSSGEVLAQHVLPRKIYVTDSDGRFRNTGECLMAEAGGSLYCFVLEHPANEKQSAALFRYNDFVKLKGAFPGNLAAYILLPNQVVDKKTIFASGNLKYIPLKSRQSAKELVFYLMNGSEEKFLFLTLN